ncbi:hypothetical protein VW23_013975 [Devosia insulae DS-56]|uniref:Uncharacterized protein n=1 Tax=Devosia insulae DS-56 TaxID=1116389 RepID=A0A1E5XTJ9_9HYPH|nr:DUF5677 domain-containing protein [Devosia insulae]OEO31928.1 hypothetical protein VW23_013975 [Devosia insulae DS-56]
MTKGPFLQELQSKIEDALEPLLADLSGQTLKRTISKIQREAVRSSLAAYRKSAPAMLEARRKGARSFEARTLRRWKRAIDLFETIIVIARELGSYNNDELRPSAADEDDYIFDALAHLHARGVLIAEEIACLLRGGFPDAALARWRALHEVNVTAAFIAKHGNDTALNYLGSFHFNARRAAAQLNQYAERAGITPFDHDDIQSLDAACLGAERQIGRAIGPDYDWARPAIQKDRVTFADIEFDVGLDHWRPRYRWASQHNHSGFRPADKLLGMVEAAEYIFLTGASNSGFVDPLDMTAISLVHLTSTFLLYKPNADRVVHIETLMKMQEKLGPLALRIERTTLNTHRRKNPMQQTT